jgi:hypothetical protein
MPCDINRIIAHLFLAAVLLYICLNVSTGFANFSNYRAERRVSALGRIERGIAAGMRYRVRLVSGDCSMHSSSDWAESPGYRSISSMLRHQRRAFLFQVGRWEFVPPSYKMAQATLSNQVECYTVGEDVFSVASVFEESFPYEKPFHSIKTLVSFGEEYALKNLSDLFKVNESRRTLEILSGYARSDLQRQLLDRGDEIGVTSWIERGTKPSYDSFPHFVLTNEGLRLFFEEYQVSSYSDGVMSALIPWSVLESVLSDDLRRSLGSKLPPPAQF